MRKKLLLVVATAAIAVLAAVPAWAVEGAPTVLKSDPQEDETANPIFVSRNMTVKVYFSEPMDPSTINSNTLYISQGCGFACGLPEITVPATVKYNAKKNMATVDPNSRLIAGEQFAIIVLGESALSEFTVRDAEGVAMEHSYVQRFRTR